MNEAIQETTADVLPASFAYDDDKQSIVVEQRFSEAQTLMRQGLANMIEAGGKFAEIRELLSHNRRGGFESWISSKQMDRRTVYRIIDLHRAFATVPQMAQLDIAATAAYLLAAPSVPEAARQEAITRAEAGERITVPAAKAIIANNTSGVAHMADPDELKPDVIAWARTLSTADPRGVLQQIVIRNGPLADKYMDRLGFYLRERDHRFTSANAKTAVQRCIEDLALPAPRVVVFGPAPDGVVGTPTPPATKATCRICGRPLTDPLSIARGYGDECAGRANGNGHSVTLPAQPAEPEPQPAADDVDLPAVVTAWLAERIDNLELADDDEARTQCLTQILKARNGFGSPTGAAAWKSLRGYAGWPAGTDNDAKAAGVKHTLAQFTGAAEEEEAADADDAPAARPAHSWDGVKPVAGGGNGAARRGGLKPGSDTYNTLLDRKTGHVERFIRAAGALRAWAAGHQPQIDDDAELRSALKLLEDARIQALCLD